MDCVLDHLDRLIDADLFRQIGTVLIDRLGFDTQNLSYLIRAVALNQ